MIIKLLICQITTLLVAIQGFSQQQVDTVHISFSKTTSVIFKYRIVNVDRGSSDVIAQKIEDADNVLQLKAGRKTFPVTNVSVITADGNLHHFYINYSECPETQIYHVDKGLSKVRLSSNRSEIEYEITTDRILSDVTGGVVSRDRDFKINYSLKAVYTHDDMMFFKLHIRNRSNIKYDIQSLRFFVRDIKKLKRTSAQEIELHPLYVRNATTDVHGHGSVDIIYIFKKFTISNGNTLDIELFEKHGGRNLKLRISNRSIVNAKKLPIN